MLNFSIETEDADWWVSVYKYDCEVGQIYQPIFKEEYIFTSLSCGCNADELIIIANKMKEMENVRTKAS